VFSPFRAGGFDTAIDGCKQIRFCEWLWQIGSAKRFYLRDGCFVFVGAAGKQHGYAFIDLAESLGASQAIQIWHSKVGDYAGDFLMLLSEKGEGFYAVVGDNRAVAAGFEGRFHDLAYGVFVVGDQD